MESPYTTFRSRAQERPDDVLLRAPASAGLHYAPQGFSISYGEMLAAVEILRERFARSGYTSGMRVALLLENRPDFFTYWLALNALGISIVPINPDLRPQELDHQLSISRTDLLVTWSRELPLLAAIDVPGIRVIEVGDCIPAATVHDPLTADIAETECALLFTSGSSGKPKGCMLSNRYFMILADWYVGQGGIAAMQDGAEVALTPLPMFHMNALGCTALGMIVKGGTIVPLDRFHASKWWQTVADSGATIIHCLGIIPAILLQLPQDEAERTHRVKFSLGPGVDAQHKIRFEDRYNIPIVEAWAMTETGGAAVTTTAQDNYVPGLRCIGRPRAGMEYRIVDDFGKSAAMGQPGELLVRAVGPDPRRGFFSGYLGDPEATEAAWQGGWFHTGDLVCFDENGLLYFFDRKKSIVRRSGENIAVLEVEAALANPRIEAAAVTPVPDELRGEEVFAFLVCKSKAEDERSFAQAVVHEAAASLSYHKLPGYIAYLDRLPLSATQKLQRGELKALAAKYLEEGRAIDLRDLKGKLRQGNARRA